MAVSRDSIVILHIVRERAHRQSCRKDKDEHQVLNICAKSTLNIHFRALEL